METKGELVKKYIALGSSFNLDKKNILHTLQTQGELTVCDNLAKESNLCILLSCPGEQEFIEQKVAAGQTGKNIDAILNIILSKENGICPQNAGEQSPIRYNFNIINACSTVHFRKYNGAEPSNAEILDKENIARVKKLLSSINIEYFIVCGDKAKLLYSQLNLSDKKTAFVSHLGNVGLRNKFPKSYQIATGMKISNLKREDRDSYRIQLTSNKIIASFNGIECKHF